jgi:FkbM family methyltransferase
MFRKLIEDYKIKVVGIIQLGAHFWQEKEMFLQMGITNFILVEPQGWAYEILQSKIDGLNASVFRCAVSDFEGIGILNADANNLGMSSSLLKPKKHLEIYPNISFRIKEEVQVKKIENIPFDRSKYNVLYMDIQGNELRALQGAESTFLKGIDAIYTEVNFIELFENCTLISQLDEYLKTFGFTRVYTNEIEPGVWGDAFYLKSALLDI